jgi:signal peptidase I
MSPAASRPSETHALKCELASEVLRSSGQLCLQATGWSMLPTIWPGDVILIEPARASEICAGDIVVFNTSRQFVAHRVVATTRGRVGSTLHTQGDALPCQDAPLLCRDLMGKVSMILRNGRCIKPRKTLRTSERVVATALQHSEFAARVVIGLHGMRQASKVQFSQVQISSDRAVPCQR